MNHTEQIILGGGCFWCLEALYTKVQGVTQVISGYAGGTIKNPTYTQVCNGTTGYIEVVQVTFDPANISLEIILDMFWHMHDPTSVNKQGSDVGEQYRSAIFFTNDAQLPIIIASKEAIDASGYFTQPIVTIVKALDIFYPAENYHQNYYEQNPNQPYCRIIIDPKLRTFINQYSEYLNP